MDPVALDHCMLSGSLRALAADRRATSNLLVDDLSPIDPAG
ncbi:MAG TPA: hypothetical protein VMV92_30280 [Streptosporangiaceae bacterium]|nr:hypothetical protein [Streptosporangiaceae bacterium]